MAKVLRLNPGSQREFVENAHRASAFIGGLGSGKTFAGIARALRFAQQPKVDGTLYGARGCVAAINYPVLKDVVLPQFFEMVEGTDLLVDYIRSEKKAIVAVPGMKPRKTAGGWADVAEVLFRSLDQPNWMRGLELSWFFIDEGRHLTIEAWRVLWGRLRQKGYQHAGWVCSTPNGYDWMWQLFHPDSDARLADSAWYGAPTMENRQNLPEGYIESLMAQYEGRFLRQEVYGEFVGVTQGAVFFGWDPARGLGQVPYEPDLPLYSFWDFGMGDLNVVEFAQVDHIERVVESPMGIQYREWVPVLRVIGAMEATDRTSREWAQAFTRYCEQHFDGRRPDLNVGDPAGRQRNQVTGTSVIDDLAAHGVPVVPAPKRAPDYAVRILNNMMEGGRVLVDATNTLRLSAAIASHRWPTDDAGNKTGTKPVHDWTSHYCDALRYGVTVLLTHTNRRRSEPPKKFQPYQYGYVFEQLLRQPSGWLGEPDAPTLTWQPGLLGSAAES